MAAASHVATSFSDRLARCAERVEYRLVQGEALEAVYRLRYDAYVREGIVPIDPSKRFADKYDEAPNVWIFGVYLDGELASSIRVHVASPQCPISPSVDVFPDILKPALERGQTIVDPTRFVAHRELGRLNPELPYVTVRLGFLASEYFNADLGLASVRAEHQAFYKRLFQLKPLCEPRTFPNLTALFVLMGVNYPSVKEQIIARYPFMRSDMQEMSALFGPIGLWPRNPLRMGPAPTPHAGNEAGILRLSAE